MKRKLIIIYIFLPILFISFQNCSPNFESNSTLESSSFQSVNIDESSLENNEIIESSQTLPQPKPLHPKEGENIELSSDITYQWSIPLDTILLVTHFELYIYDENLKKGVHSIKLDTQEVCLNSGICSYKIEDKNLLTVGTNHAWRIRSINFTTNTDYSYTQFNITSSIEDIETASEQESDMLRTDQISSNDNIKHLPLAKPKALEPKSGENYYSGMDLNYRWQVPINNLSLITSFDYYLFDRTSNKTVLSLSLKPKDVCDSSGNCSFKPNKNDLLKIGSNHVWRVRSKTSMINTDYSYTSFNILPNTNLESTQSSNQNSIVNISKPIPLAPISGKNINFGTSINYKWSVPSDKVSLITYFDFYLYDRNLKKITFSIELKTNEVCSNTGLCVYKPDQTDALSIGKNQVWRVRSRNSSDQSQYSFIEFNIVPNPSLINAGQTSNNTLASYSFGVNYGSKALANLRVGALNSRVSASFIAKTTSSIKEIKAYWTWNYKRAGYHKGNGGVIKVDIVNDDSNKPGEIIHATGTLTPKLETKASISTFTPLAMNSIKSLNKGSKYWILFTNISNDKENNYLSVNSMFGENGYQKNKINSDQLGRSIYTQANGQWTTSEHQLIHQLKYSDNKIQGYGIIGGFAYSTQLYFGGNNLIRQRFSLDQPNEIKNIWVRLARISGSGNVKLSIKDKDGHVISSAEPTFSTIPMQVGTAPSGHDWVLFPIAADLVANKDYYAVLSAPKGSTYFSYPQQLGKGSYNFSPVTYGFKGHFAQRSINNGNSWLGWEYYTSNNRTDSELQIFFNKGFEGI